MTTPRRRQAGERRLTRVRNEYHAGTTRASDDLTAKHPAPDLHGHRGEAVSEGATRYFRTRLRL
jgi:hypothetical protein